MKILMAALAAHPVDRPRCRVSPRWPPRMFMCALLSSSRYSNRLRAAVRATSEAGWGPWNSSRMYTFALFDHRGDLRVVKLA